MKKSYKISDMQNKIDALERYAITQAIAQNQTLQARAFDPGKLSNEMAQHFSLKQDGDVFRLVPKEMQLSIRVAGEYADASETIENLLANEYQQHLWPDTNENGNGVPLEASEGTADARLEDLKARYQAARDRGDSGTMVSLKRRIAGAGYADQIL